MMRRNREQGRGMDTVTAALQERRDDLNDGVPGNVRAQVETAMNLADEHLMDHAEGSGAYSLQRAAEALQAAVDALTLARTRIERLDAAEAQRASVQS
jgi:hypothetical protein